MLVQLCIYVPDKTKLLSAVVSHLNVPIRLLIPLPAAPLASRAADSEEFAAPVASPAADSEENAVATAATTYPAVIPYSFSTFVLFINFLDYSFYFSSFFYLLLRSQEEAQVASFFPEACSVYFLLTSIGNSL